MNYIANLPTELGIKVWKLVYDETMDVIRKSKLVWLRKTVPIVHESYQCVKLHGHYNWSINDADTITFECLGYDDFDMVYSNIEAWNGCMTNNRRTWLVQVHSQWYISRSYETDFIDSMLQRTHPYLGNQSIDANVNTTHFKVARTTSTPWWEERVYWKELYQSVLEHIEHGEHNKYNKRNKHHLNGPIVSIYHPRAWKLIKVN
jgi:hypothetical protein